MLPSKHDTYFLFSQWFELKECDDNLLQIPSKRCSVTTGRQCSENLSTVSGKHFHNKFFGVVEPYHHLDDVLDLTQLVFHQFFWNRILTEWKSYNFMT